MHTALRSASAALGLTVGAEQRRGIGGIKGIREDLIQRWVVIQIHGLDGRGAECSERECLKQIVVGHERVERSRVVKQSDRED